MPDPRPGQATSPAAGPPHARKQKKTGRFWFYAAAVVGCAVLIAGVLVWGANGPLLPGAGAPTVTRGYWNLSDWAGLGALAVLVLGLPCAALLAFVGVAYRHNPKAPWWIAAFLLGALGLKAIGWYRDATMAEQESYGPLAERHTSPEVVAQLDALVTWKVPESLLRYNRMLVTQDYRASSSPLDRQSMAFGEVPFDCVQQKDHLPKESPAAQRAFDKFLAYYDEATREDISAEEQKERLRLFEAAIKAGSWRARLTDLLGQVYRNRDRKESLRLQAELLRMAEGQNPVIVAAAAARIEDYADGRPTLDGLLRTGIERGSPQVMTDIGGRLAVNVLEHRARGLAMLRCAADQGGVEAYHPLAETARREGRWVDAYRIFEMGANQGCMPCMEELEALALLNPGFSGGRYDTEGEVPAINQLRSFYGQQFLWRLTGLMELRRPAPQSIQLQLSDEEVRGLIELEMKESRQKPAPR